MTAGRKVNSQSQDWGTPPKYIRVVKEVWVSGILRGADFYHTKSGCLMSLATRCSGVID